MWVRAKQAHGDDSGREHLKIGHSDGESVAVKPLGPGPRQVLPDNEESFIRPQLQPYRELKKRVGCFRGMMRHAAPGTPANTNHGSSFMVAIPAILLGEHKV